MSPSNYVISLMEEVFLENKDFMKARERHYIENNECVNKCVPNRTGKELYEANKEKRLEYRKDYYDENKVEILEKKKQKITCKCGSTFRIDGLAEHKRSKKHLAHLSSK